jgi:hypothetical protein
MSYGRAARKAAARCRGAAAKPTEGSKSTKFVADARRGWQIMPHTNLLEGLEVCPFERAVQQLPVTLPVCLHRLAPSLKGRLGRRGLRQQRADSVAQHSL